MAANKTSSDSKGKGKPQGAKDAPKQRPIRREVGSIVFMFLGIFSFIGYFDIHALFIDGFCGFVKGMVGWGYYIFPPTLLFCSYILAFHRGRPVRFRLFCTLALPVMFGALLHLVLFDGTSELRSGFDMLSDLYKGGSNMVSGGLFSGFMSICFEKMFSIYGTIPVFLILTGFFSMGAFNMSVQKIFDYLKNMNYPPYQPEVPASAKPEPKPVQEADPLPSLSKKKNDAPSMPQPAAAAASAPALFPRRRSNIDIPMDESKDNKRWAEPPVKAKGFFNKIPRVRTPEQQLMLEDGEEEIEKVPEPVIVEPPEEILPFSNTENIDSVADVKDSAPDSEEDKIEGVGESVMPVTQEINDPPKPPKKMTKAEQVAAETESIAKTIENDTYDGSYSYPPLDLLQKGAGVSVDGRAEMSLNSDRIESALKSFGVSAAIVDVTRGPTVTRYDLELDTGVKLNKLTGLSEDLALSLGVSGVRIAPIPNKISTVGIEVPNKVVSTIYLRDIIDTKEFKSAKSKLSFAIGKDISGNVIVGDIAKLPHMLIAGTTGSGKSVCVNAMILSILYKSTPDEVRFIMIDPKMVEFVVYNEIPHLYIPVVTDPKKAAGALQWAVVEMMKRYRLFSEAGVRDLTGYNNLKKQQGESTMPQVVIVIDELADLMIAAAKEVEESICRVAQMGRASGMHLVIATQRPSADVITGLMKANIPSRIALFVRSSMDSRIILDATGADKLVGNGDMLYLPVGAGKPLRVQGAWVSDEEREGVVEFVKTTGESQYDEDIIEEIERASIDKAGSKNEGAAGDNDYDDMLNDAVDVIFDTKQASVSMLQRRLKLGYARAARIVDQMEEIGIVGGSEGSKPRQILMTREQWMLRQNKSGSVSDDVDIMDAMDFEEQDDDIPFDMDEQAE